MIGTQSVSSREEASSASLEISEIAQILSGHNFSTVSWNSSILTNGVSEHNFSTLSWKCAARNILSSGSGRRFTPSWKCAAKVTYSSHDLLSVCGFVVS